MKLPSVSTLMQGAHATLLRFPFVLLSAAVATIAIIVETNDERFIRAGFLGISLLFAIEMFAERNRWGRGARIIGGVAGIILMAGYFLIAPADNYSDMDNIRFMVLGVALHFLAAVSPYLVRDELNGFWQYNRMIFLRILLSGLYTGVLYLGISLALLAIDNLFDANFEEDIYLKLGAFLFGMFNTWFFLAGVPDNFEVLEQDRSYPQGLKVFTQYVLLPLVTIYLVILYLYAGKIVLTWEWPNGWVSMLILCFSVAGILSSLLLYPIRNAEGHNWIGRFYSWFYWALLPLVVLLVLAVWRRVSEYGITESRYFAYALAFWLALAAIYALFTRGRNIRMIPLSLCVLSFLSTFGPWGAFQVSVNSQVNQLREVLEKEGLFADGRLVNATKEKSKDGESRISSILYYLEEHDAFSEITPWLGDTANTTSTENVFAAFGVEHYSYARTTSEYDHMWFATDPATSMDISGYERLLRYERPYRDIARASVYFGTDTLNVMYDGDSEAVIFSRRGDRLLSIGLLDLVRKLREEKVSENFGTLPRESMTLEGSGNGIAAKILLNEVASARIGDSDSVIVTMWQGDILIRRTNADTPNIATPDIDTLSVDTLNIGR